MCIYQGCISRKHCKPKLIVAPLATIVLRSTCDAIGKRSPGKMTYIHFRFYFCALVRQAEQPIRMCLTDFPTLINMLNRPRSLRWGLTNDDGAEHTTNKLS